MLETTLQQLNDSTYKMSTCHQSLVSLYEIVCEFYTIFLYIVCYLLWTKELFHAILSQKRNWNEKKTPCYHRQKNDSSFSNIDSNLQKKKTWSFQNQKFHCFYLMKYHSCSYLISFQSFYRTLTLMGLFFMVVEYAFTTIKE